MGTRPIVEMRINLTINGLRNKSIIEAKKNRWLCKKSKKNYMAMETNLWLWEQ
jgi:hypothetical protein